MLRRDRGIFGQGMLERKSAEIYGGSEGGDEDGRGRKGKREMEADNPLW